MTKDRNLPKFHVTQINLRTALKSQLKSMQTFSRQCNLQLSHICLNNSSFCGLKASGLEHIHLFTSFSKIHLSSYWHKKQ